MGVRPRKAEVRACTVAIVTSRNEPRYHWSAGVRRSISIANPRTAPSRSVMPASRRPGLFGLVLLALGMTGGNTPTAHANGTYYTPAQAEVGRAVFHQQCALCHGDDLHGKSGPALAGDQFLSVSQYQNLTADYLYRFMSRHMPLNAPGSLSKAQYLGALAYILKVNGYPSGRQALTDDDRRLTQIKIEPTGIPQQSSR